MDLAIIADDLTGAADTAAPFVDGSRMVRVVLDAHEGTTGDIMALDTATRDRPPDQAATCVTTAVETLASHRPTHWLKKLDSMLRGNVTAETAAFAAAADCARFIVAPAYPHQGRVTIDGRQLVDGALATGSHATSDLPTLLAATTLPITHAPLATVRSPGMLATLLRDAAPQCLFVCDATEDADLEQIVAAAQALPGRVGFIGSAGLAEALRRAERASNISQGFYPPKLSRQPALFLVGSLHPASRRQLAVLVSKSGQAPIIVPAARHGGEASLAEDAGRRLRDDGVALIATASEPSALPPLSIAQGLASFGAELVGRHGVRRVFVTGGEVARALCDMLGIHALTVQGSVVDGVPALTAEDGVPNLTLVTKAGGFGDDQALLRAAAYLLGRNDDL